MSLRYYDHDSGCRIAPELVKAAFPKAHGYFELELKGGHTVRNAEPIDVMLIPNQNPNLYIITTEEGVLDEGSDDSTSEVIQTYAIVAWHIELSQLEHSSVVKPRPIVANERLCEEAASTRWQQLILDKSTGLICDAAGSWVAHQTYASFQAEVEARNAKARAERAACFVAWTVDDWLAGRCSKENIGKPSPVLKESEGLTAPAD